MNRAVSAAVANSGGRAAGTVERLKGKMMKRPKHDGEEKPVVAPNLNKGVNQQ
jgi:hypothetical protein